MSEAGNTWDLVVGIDGGVTGALAGHFRDGTWQTQPVRITRVDGDRRLAVKENLELLRQMTGKLPRAARILVAYERSRKNPMFGIKNSFANGQNDEFWRVLLTMGGFEFVAVDPMTWHAAFRKGRRGKTSKARSLNFLKAKCPDLVWLKRYKQAERLGVIDAMCIALWARSHALNDA